MILENKLTNLDPIPHTRDMTTTDGTCEECNVFWYDAISDGLCPECVARFAHDDYLEDQAIMDRDDPIDFYQGD
jgi:hypothetical protein